MYKSIFHVDKSIVHLGAGTNVQIIEGSSTWVQAIDSIEAASDIHSGSRGSVPFPGIFIPKDKNVQQSIWINR
jgi:hypothetical protein